MSIVDQLIPEFYEPKRIVIEILRGDSEGLEVGQLRNVLQAFG